MEDKIFLRQLKFKTIIGIFPHEKLIPQTIIIDLEIKKNFQNAIKTDSIEDTICYETLVNELENFFSNNSSNLLESLADKVAYFILKKFKAPKVKVTLTKPAAIPHSLEVGVIVERSNDK